MYLIIRLFYDKKMNLITSVRQTFNIFIITLYLSVVDIVLQYDCFQCNRNWKTMRLKNLMKEYSTCDHVIWWFEDQRQVTDWLKLWGTSEGIKPVNDLPEISKTPKIHSHKMNIAALTFHLVCITMSKSP